jgi:[ribosomal protein S5]-alanine N-acetyltransferase
MVENDDFPTLVGAGVTLRELRPSDSATLFTLLTEEQVVKFISPPPTSPAGFETFINWSIGERKRGRHFSFGVVPEGLTAPVGIFQLRMLDRGSNVAEWGFVLAYQFWGTGRFPEAAHLMLAFAFDTLGINRLEARASVPNERGSGALAKVTAVHEVKMRESFKRHGIWYDQVLWSILADEWRAREQQRRKVAGRSPDSNKPIDDIEGHGNADPEGTGTRTWEDRT